MRPKGKMELQPHDLPQTLVEETRRLLKADPRTLRLIGQWTGIPFFWLKKLSAGEIANPAVNRIQYLYEFLSKKKLLALPETCATISSKS